MKSTGIEIVAKILEDLIESSIDVLNDGHALGKMGYTDEDESEIDEAYHVLVKLSKVNLKTLIESIA